MSNQKIELNAKIRTKKGKADVRRMRRLENIVPAIVYGAGKPSQMITLDHSILLKYLGQESFYSQVIFLNVDGQQESVVLKDAHFYPGKPKVLHVDFQRVSATEKLLMKIPLHFIGEENAPGTKVGGVISHNLSEVEVRCLPADLPESIDIDVSKMELNQVLHLTDIKPPSGVKLMALAHGDQDHDLPVASIHLPKVSVEEEPSDEETAEADDASKPEASTDQS